MARRLFQCFLLLIFSLLLAPIAMARADDGRAGVVEWSDGHKQSGAISLTAGKSLRVFTGDQSVSITLDEVKEIRFLPEKEQMGEGFYFPNAGQATQVKTGDVYPIRYLKAEVTLGDGQVIAGHLATTVFYIEDADGTAQKLVVMAKQSGTDGEKMADLIYPTTIRFDAGAASTGSVIIDLTSAGLRDLQPPIILTQPDLSTLAAHQTAGKPIWTVPIDDPAKIIFSVEAADGIHVAWPGDSGPTITDYISKQGDPAPEYPPSDVDPMIRVAVEVGLRDMRDFYDTRTLLGSFTGSDGTDIYSLVMMKRLARSLNGDATPFPSDQTPWSLVMLRWKYDADAKKVTLLNRAMLAIGRIDAKTPEPKIFREPGLSRDMSHEQ